MKRGIALICSLAMVMQLLLGTVPVFADESGIGEAYTAPESPAITYNMNLDWKFFDCGVAGANLMNDIWDVMAVADKNGKKFYEKDYDDTAWETVSIPHGIGGGTNSFTGANSDAGGGYRSVLLYRKTITVPNYQAGSKVFFELDGIRQGAYVWVNGQKVGYYEAGVAAMGFDISNYIDSDGKAVIALLDDGMTARGVPKNRIPYETVPGEEWGSSYSNNNYGNTVGEGASYVWNTKDFNEPQIGLVYNAYLHVKGNVYQTLPLYNNLKTTGNYIYADNFSIRDKTATIHVDAEVRNESAADGSYTLEVAVVDGDGSLKYTFKSDATEVKAAGDAGVVYQTAVEEEAYSEEGLANSVGITKVNTPDVTHITASYNAEDMRFWSTDDPYLYTVYTILRDGSGNAVDVQKKETGFRKVTYSDGNGILINDQPCWMPGYAQRATNEWAVIGVATDWLQDYDMALLKENNSNFIRWMHVAPKPNSVRSSDRYGVAVVVPAGDKEGVGLTGRQWSQRVEAMRDVMIYFRNSPSVIFWETGNSAVGSAENANEMAALRDKIDPYGMRFIGARSTKSADQLNYDYNYAGTMYGGYASDAQSAMKTNGKPGPIMETEYARNEAPRRVWDRYSPPDFDYVNKYISKGGKMDGYDVWNETSEDNAVNTTKEYNGYYSSRGTVYSAAAMMIWSDSNMHTRNTASENCRTSGRVDPVRQTKESFYSTQTAQSSTPAVHIVGHWSYPQVSDDTYNYFDTDTITIDTNHNYELYNPEKKLKRDPTKKTVYVIGSADIKKVELYVVEGDKETLIGTDDSADSTFVYQFDNIDVTQGDAVTAKAYNARGELVADDEHVRTGEKFALRITPHTAVSEDASGNTVSDWRADGSDIAYFDIEVVDKDGNVCVLNYDRINLSWEGNGEFLGGYNSGSGSGCYQNSSASSGLSNYFGGAKDGVSTIGKNYVYAENGTNRIFVRSTREAGVFTLKASMDGIPEISKSIQSTAVETTGGLTTQMQSTLSPDAKEPPKFSNVPAMKALMLSKKLIDWTKIETVKEIDTTDYYETYLNGQKLTLTAESRMGAMNTVFGPITEIMDALKTAGVDSFSYTKNDTTVSVAVSADIDSYIGEMKVTAGTYNFIDGANQLYKEGVNDPISETVEASKMEKGVMISNLEILFSLIDGASFTVDKDNNRIDITTVTGGAE